MIELMWNSQFAMEKQYCDNIEKKEHQRNINALVD